MSDEREAPGFPGQQPAAGGGESTRERATVVRDNGSSPQADVPRPNRIGPYRIIGRLGEGGMGVVFEAEQESPRRKVAVKVIRGGQLVDESQVRMFQREVDTLARLQHPNIGGIYESGRTEDGQHFFAMELVRGVTLDTYLAKRGPVTSAAEVEFRLALFRSIVDAVSYAHQRGVIHRDLKPANIIVSEEAPGAEPPGGALDAPTRTRLPIVKVLDFGLARITGQDVSAATKATELGVIKGTLLYMSPEQARGDPAEVDVRADVYALGVVLYEMLSGRRPYDLARLAVVEALRVICETPPRPLHASMNAAFRLDPDIETIVGKALEKEAGRRYVSAAALSEDISRCLSSQPILARPPSAAYQLRKFAARNRVLVGGVSATLLALMAGAVLVTLFGVREARQRRAAEQARNDLEKVAAFQSGMLSRMDPERVGARLRADLEQRVGDLQQQRGVKEPEVAAARRAFATAVRGVNFTDAALRLIDEEILARAVKTVGEQFAEQPLIDARLRDTIGETYASLGLYPPAEEQLRTSLELRRGRLGEEDPLTLSSAEHLANLYLLQGRYEESDKLADLTLASRRKVLGEAHPDTFVSLNALALVYTKLGRFEAAEKLYQQVLEAQRRALGDEHPDTLVSRNNLSIMYYDWGRRDEALRLDEGTLAIRRRVLGDEHPDTLVSINNLAILYRENGRLKEAEGLFLEALGARTRALGAHHFETNRPRRNLIILYQLQGRSRELVPLLRDDLEARRVIADRPDATAAELNDAAWQFLTVEPADLRDPAVALRYAQRSCAKEEAANGGELWNFLDTLALALHTTGDTAAAIATEKKALALLAQDRPEREGLQRQLAEFERALQRKAGAAR